ncbi:MAG: hypothetical protein MW690_000535 [Methanophagales archaeon]|nr:hypothetical protein [Methanophagales archaeon]
MGKAKNALLLLLLASLTTVSVIPLTTASSTPPPSLPPAPTTASHTPSPASPLTKVITDRSIPTLKPPLNFDNFSTEEITFDKSGDEWVLKDGEGDIIGVEISGWYESIALLKRRIAVNLTKSLIVEYKIRFYFRESESHATVNIFLDPPANESWWNDPIGGYTGKINDDVLNFLHSFGRDSCYGGKVGVADNVEGSGIPCKSAPYPRDGEWVTVKVMMNEGGFHVISKGDKGYSREEFYSYDLRGVRYIGVGFGDQRRTRVEVDYIKIYYGPLSIWTDKSEYELGDVVKLGLEINNTFGLPIMTQFSLKLEQPGGDIDTIYESSPFLMPAGFHFKKNVPFPIPVSWFIEGGNYTFVATLMAPTTNETLGEDAAKFHISDEMRAAKEFQSLDEALGEAAARQAGRA